MSKYTKTSLLLFSILLLNETAFSQANDFNRTQRIQSLLNRQQNGRSVIGGVISESQTAPRGFIRPLNPRTQLPHFGLTGFEIFTVTFKEGASVSVLKSHLIQARNSVSTKDETGRTIRDPSDLLRTLESLDRAIKTLDESAQKNGKLVKPTSVELHIGEVMLKQGDDLKVAIQKHLPEIQLRNVKDVRVATRTLSPKRTAALSAALVDAKTAGRFSKKSKVAAFLSLGVLAIGTQPEKTLTAELD